MFKSLFSRNKPDPSAESQVQSALNDYRSDVFPVGILPLCRSVEVTVEKDTIKVALTLPFPCVSELSRFAEQLQQTIQRSVEILPTFDVSQVRRHSITGVKNIIAVSSGKGGVGKSTTAVNLAYALMAEGASVGILDADIYGPSIPTMLGTVDEQPTSPDGKVLSPIDANGLSSMSIGYLTDDAKATVWRGPMASSAFSQMLNETLWGELDYLIVDMPPGTGDIQLTLAQKVPVAASIIVTTPQDIALIDAEKGMAMFDQVSVPVLGIVENMSYHVCENCGHHSHIFGKEGAAKLSEAQQTELLGQLPLNIDIREQVDTGNCSLLENSSSEVSMLYRKIAGNVSSKLFHTLDINSPLTAELIINEE